MIKQIFIKASEKGLGIILANENTVGATNFQKSVDQGLVNVQHDLPTLHWIYYHSLFNYTSF